MVESSYRYLHSAVYRLKDLIKGTGIYRQLSELQAEQYLSPLELEALQAQRLKALLLKAQLHSSYYKELFKRNNIQVPKDVKLSILQKIPLMTRHDLQANLNKIICDDARDIMLNSSGGSTGIPVNFYQNSGYWNYSQAAELLFLSWMGVQFGDKTAVFWGADREFKDLSLRNKLWIRFDRQRWLNSFSMTEQAMAEFIDKLNTFKPRYIFGYASSLFHVAKLINQYKPLKFKPLAVRSSAETLYDFQRQEIEKAFGVNVYNFYGSREVNNLASECHAHEGLHILSSGRIIEIVDDDGLPVPDGTPGHVAVTDLVNYAFPFIRYLNGDQAIKSPKACSCGRGYGLLEKIQGRTSDMIVINGQHIHGEFFTHLFYQKPEVRQFQVIQEDEETLRLLVVANAENNSVDDIVSRIRQKVGEKVKLHLDYTDSIACSGSGKFRFTISKLDKNLSMQKERESLQKQNVSTLSADDRGI